MKSPTALALILCAAAALVSRSAVAAPAGACFWVRGVENFASVDPDTVYVRADGRHVYELKLFGHCLDVHWSHRIGIRTRGSSMICEGRANNAEILVRSLGRNHRCPIAGVRRLTPDEANALPKGARP